MRSPIGASTTTLSPTCFPKRLFPIGDNTETGCIPLFQKVYFFCPNYLINDFITICRIRIRQIAPKRTLSLGMVLMSITFR